jgi:hypothetical protein
MSLNEITERYGNGEINSLKEYIIECASQLPAFGGFKHLIHDVLLPDIAEKYINDYILIFQKRYNDAKIELENWDSSSDKEKYNNYLNFVNQGKLNRDISENKTKITRYNNLLEELTNWKPGDGLKGFRSALINIVKHHLENESMLTNLDNREKLIPDFDDWKSIQRNMLARSLSHRKLDLENEKHNGNIFLSYVNELRKL